MTTSTAGLESKDNPTPIAITRRTLRLLLAVAVAVLVLVGWAAPIALTMLLGGVTIALFLSFPVTQLARIMPRGLAVLLTFAAAFTIGALVLVLLVPVLVEQLTDLVAAAPEFSTNTDRFLRGVLQTLDERGLLDREPDEVTQSLRAGVVDRLEILLQAVLGSLLSVLSNALGFLVRLSVMLIVAVYLLSGTGQATATIVKATPARYRHDMEELLVTLQQSLSRFLVGLLISAVEQGTLAALALWLLGVPYAFLLGVLMALTSFVPYIGAWLAAVPAVIVALSQSPLTAVLTVVAYVAINTFDSNIVMPRVQGQALHLSPLVTLLAVIAGGEIFGPLGTILALPVVGVLRVLYDFLAARVQVRPPDSSVVMPVAAPRRGHLRRRALPARRPSSTVRRRRVARAARSQEGGTG